MHASHNRFFVLTGGPGSGKTTLIEALEARGYATTEEAGRGVIREQMQGGGSGRVFIAPPWKEIFGADEERRQSWEVAVRTYETMVGTYSDLGYALVELPCTTVERRADFVIAAVGRALHHRKERPG